MLASWYKFVNSYRRKEPGRTKSLAIRATRPHTVGYIGGGDQEQGVIESPCRTREAHGGGEEVGHVGEHQHQRDLQRAVWGFEFSNVVSLYGG